VSTDVSFRAMNRFGMPLVPAQLATVLHFVEPPFIATFKGTGRVANYSIGVGSPRRRCCADGVRLRCRRSRTNRDDNDARRTYGYVLTYVLFITCWVSLGLALLAPWFVRLPDRPAGFYAGARVVGHALIQRGRVGAYTVVAIGNRAARFTSVSTGSSPA